MLEQTIKIKSYDVHPNGVVKISALQKYMQQIAREDSDSYGATYAKMRDANMVFVITPLAHGIRAAAARRGYCDHPHDQQPAGGRFVRS